MDGEIVFDLICLIIAILITLGSDDMPVLRALGVGLIVVWSVTLCSDINKDSEKSVPTALDVYRGNTTLKISYQDSIPIDTVVVFKKEFKQMCVEAVLNEVGSVDDIVAKYNISDRRVLRRWIKKYNAHIELKDYTPNREVYMAESRRKTTIEERKEIVDYCITHNCNYRDTADFYDVSYSQVYSWVKKYNEKGIEGLQDKRGRHKTDDEVDELECLKRENSRLKRQLEEHDMLTELLKKVQEFERM